MRVVQVKSKKGGVGKSLAARELALILAAAGFYTLLIDASEQANDDILENQDRDFPSTLKECIIDGISLKDAARQVRKRLWLIAGTRDHEDVNNFIRKERYQDIIRDMITELRAGLTPVPAFDQRFPWWSHERVSFTIFNSEPTSEEEFGSGPQHLDFLLIDSDASTEDDLTFVLWEAIDGILIPYEPTELDWQSYHQLKQDLAKRYHRRPEKQPPIVGLLPNKVLHVKDHLTPLTYLKAVYQHAEEHVFRPIHWSKIFSECLNLRIGSLEHPSSGTDRAVREMAAIALEIMGYEGELAGLKICEKCAEQAASSEDEEEQAS